MLTNSRVSVLKKKKIKIEEMEVDDETQVSIDNGSENVEMQFNEVEGVVTEASSKKNVSNTTHNSKS